MRFQVLGLVGAWAGDTPVAVRGSKMRTFLAALLLARGRVVSDARIMEMLWDEDLPATTQAQIQTYASRLRNLLGAEAGIERRPPGYRLRLSAQDWERLDLAEFEHLAGEGHAALARSDHGRAKGLLRAALASWNGQALGGVTEHLAAVEQPRLEEARLTVLEECIDTELALGEHQRLVTELTALVAAEPLRERPRAQLITALHRCGRTADALAGYQDFRAALREALGLDPSAALQRLHRSLLTSVPAPRTEAVPLRTRLAPPTLPPEPSDFTGREGESARARAVLSGSPEQGDRPTVCVITGMDGSGKTTLALRVARSLRAVYPDRQLMVDLGGRSAVPPSAEAVLRTLLSRLGSPAAALPETLPAMVELYRRTLSGTRTLLVLANAGDERQVRPLLPGVPGCGVLVTSRTPLAALEGTTRISLGAFSPDESVELLGKIIGVRRTAAEHRAAHRIAELCGHLPMAVRVSGARLATLPHWPLGRLAERLADPRRMLKELRAGDLDVRDRLMPTFDALPDDQRRALRALTDLGPGTFSCATAAELLEMSAMDAMDLLDELVAVHLLRADEHPPNPYRLPELVHALAASQDLLRQVG